MREAAIAFAAMNLDVAASSEGRGGERKGEGREGGCGGGWGGGRREERKGGEKGWEGGCWGRGRECICEWREEVMRGVYKEGGKDREERREQKNMR